MKKMTKILSLVLALALVLGMTAMAEATKILYRDTFSDALTDGEYSIDTFKANSGTINDLKNSNGGRAIVDSATSTLSKVIVDNTKTRHTLLANGRFVVENGKVALRSPKNSDDYIIYTLATPWSRTANSGKLVGVMATIKMNSASTTKYAFMSAYTNSKTVDANNTEGDYAGFKVNADGTPVLTESIHTRTIDARAGGWGTNGAEHLANVDIGKEVEIGFVLQSTDVYGAASKALSRFSIADGTKHYSQGMSTISNAEEFTGFVIATGSVSDVDISDIKIFEMSRTAADFVLENTAATDVHVDSDLKLTFSQPFLKTFYPNRGDTNGATDYASRFVVKKGDETLVYGTDYTVDITAEVVGNEYKGVAIIKMAEDMDFNTTYTVSIAKNKLETYAKISVPSAEQSTTFTTEAAPAYSISLAAAEGLTTGTAINTAADLAGKTVYFTAEAEKTAGRAVDGVVAIGIYDAEGNLVKYAYAAKTFDAVGAKNTFSAAFKVAAGQTAKAFVKGTASTVTFGE